MEDDAAAPETEVPGAEEEGTPAADDAGEIPQPKGGKKKRTWQKVNSLYNPAPYAAQKGASKGSKGGGKGCKGGLDGEGGHKGKGKGKDLYGEGEPPKPQDDSLKAPAAAEGVGPAALDGDPMQPKLGMGGKSRKQGGKGREAKGKVGGGKALAGVPRKGGQGPVLGPGLGCGVVLPGSGPGGGPLGGAKGMPRGGMPAGEVPEAGSEPLEEPRPPGPQRAPMAGKGVGGPGGGPGVPMAMPPYSYGTAVPYSYGGVPYPYGVPAMYAMPYYVMPTPTPLNTGSSPYMPGNGPPPQSQASSDLKSQVQSQIEYYFDKDNMIKDVYLRTRLMDEEGWVQIAPLAHFRRIQSMTSDMSVIMDAIASSQKLEMDPQCQHVRLKNNWKEWVLPTTPAKAASPTPAASAQQPP